MITPQNVDFLWFAITEISYEASWPFSGTVFPPCSHNGKLWSEADPDHGCWYPGGCLILGICPKHILNPNLVKPRLPLTYFAAIPSFWNFAQSTAVSLLCSVQNLKTIINTVCNTHLTLYILVILITFCIFLFENNWCEYNNDIRWKCKLWKIRI